MVFINNKNSFWAFEVALHLSTKEYKRSDEYKRTKKRYFF